MVINMDDKFERASESTWRPLYPIVVGMLSWSYNRGAAMFCMKIDLISQGRIYCSSEKALEAEFQSFLSSHFILDQCCYLEAEYLSSLSSRSFWTVVILSSLSSQFILDCCYLEAEFSSIFLG